MKVSDRTTVQPDRMAGGQLGDVDIHEERVLLYEVSIVYVKTAL